MIKTVLLILILLFTSSFVFADSGVVAVVNKEVITQNDLDEFINFMRMQLSVRYSAEEVQQRIEEKLPDLIDRLIEDKLILQAAYDEEDLLITQSRIEARVAQIKKRYPSGEDFEAALEDQGLSIADIELKIKEQILMQAIIGRKIKSAIAIKPHEITDYYSAHSEDFVNPEQRLIRYTIVSQPKKEEVSSCLAKSESLEVIAKACVLDVVDLGWASRESLRKDIADIVYELKPGELSGILELQDSLYVFEAKAVKASEKKELLEAQDEIEQILFGEKMEVSLADWIEQLKSEAYIEIKKEKSTADSNSEN